MDHTPPTPPAPEHTPGAKPLPPLMDSTLALDWHELKVQMEDLHAKLEYAKLMLRLSLRPPTQG